MNDYEKIVEILKEKCKDISHGILSVEIHIRDSKISRIVLKKEESILAGDL